MKKVYLIGFRGTGFRDTKYNTEPGRLRTGHMGSRFEGDEERIIGFHPTEVAIQETEGAAAGLGHRRAGS